MKKIKDVTMVSNEQKRRLSPWRVLLAVLILSLVGLGSYQWWILRQEKAKTFTPSPWFAAYVDVTATPTYAFEQEGVDTESNNLVLSFIVPSASDPCKPSWGRAYTLDEAGKRLDLDRRIARYQQRGGNIAISFGGLLNSELAVECKDQTKLEAGYLDVINRYNIDTIDLDLEGNGLTDKEALKRRSMAIANIQKNRRADNKQLAVWLTLPVAPFGLTEDGTNGVAETLKSGLDLAGVNAMTMDYGNAKEKGQTMEQASEKALMETKRQLGILYEQAGIKLSDQLLWAKIGATPMIGQNDIAGEIFSLDDAVAFNTFALTNGVSRMSMWSANRDIECGENYVNVEIVSDSCSGVKQEKFGFANRLKKDLKGSISSNSSHITISVPETKEMLDDPAKSPYQIWSKESTYLEGTKVVWHQNVFQAKWWTQGDLPDNPVLQAWQTPWQLIGPVLPGEKPIPQPTLAPGTYPTWSGEDIYDAGERVLFEGIPYRAKWWTQGSSPAASSSNPDSSPWVALTQEQVDEIAKKSK